MVMRMCTISMHFPNIHHAKDQKPHETLFFLTRFETLTLQIQKQDFHPMNIRHRQ
jgi:hypothetical protein